MKSGGRGKEPPAAGEITGKRPKRKCLQWHPLLSKKALDFSEEEEEDDEEDLEKVSVSSGHSEPFYPCKNRPVHLSRKHGTALQFINLLSAASAVQSGPGSTGAKWKHNRGCGGRFQ